MSINGKTTCLICRSEEFRIVHSYDKPDKYELTVGIDSKGYKRQWVQCIKCNLYYSRYSRPENALDHIYVSTYRSGNSSWRSDTTEEIFRRVISLPSDQSETKYRVGWIKLQLETLWNSEFIPRGMSPYRMLDVGGATGVFAYEFRDRDWLAHIIDPSENGTFIQSKFSIPYAQKYYEPGCFVEPFDLITLIFVLEHYRDPISLLKQVRQDMKRQAILYVEVPDAICFRYKSPDDDIFNSCHLWMFAPVTLLKLLDICGFEAFSMQRTRTIRGHYSLMLIGGLK